MFLAPKAALRKVPQVSSAATEAKANGVNRACEEVDSRPPPVCLIGGFLALALEPEAIPKKCSVARAAPLAERRE